jgi:N-acetylglucosamine-6-sulfatase
MRQAVDRRAPALAAAGVLAIALAACDGGDEADRGPSASAQQDRLGPPGEGPNIVLVMTDDQDARSVREMPAVGRLLAARGTTFTNFHVSFPLCCPSRATLLTGQYAHNHGVVSNKPPDGGYGEFGGRKRTLGVWLQRAGYRTAWVGKYLNGYGLDGDPTVPPGWSRWVVPMGLDDLLMYGYRLNRDGDVERYGERPRDYQTDVLARQATRFVRQAAGERPFFLALAPLAPHDELDTIDTGDRDPRPAPRHHGAFATAAPPRTPSVDEAVRDDPEFLSQYRGRLESLLAVDDAVRDLVGELHRSGELADTVFIYTSDNGYLLGEHGIVGGKTLPYDEMTRVPLIVRGPGFPAEANGALAGNVDLAPTILDLAGAAGSANRRLDGVSLVPIADDPDAAPDRAIVIESEASSGVRTDRYLYVEHDSGEIELYDHGRDPFQLRNAAGDPRYGREEGDLAAALDRLRACAGAECRRPIEASATP